MPTTPHFAPLPFGRAARRLCPFPPRPGPRRRRAGNQRSDRLRSLPSRAHLIPYGSLAALGIVVLAPGVVPHGPACSGYGATAAERELFIHLSAVAFALIAGLLLASALAASAQRRAGGPGRPTVASAAVLGAGALASAIEPHAPIAAPVQALMTIDLLALLATSGLALVFPLGVVAISWHALGGPARLRAAQIAAWTTLLLVLPLIMALTYLTVTPICFG